MTDRELMEQAREAGIVVTGEAVWKLCELVAAAEREACAKVCESIDEADSRYRYDYKRGALACAAAIRSMS